MNGQRDGEHGASHGPAIHLPPPSLSPAIIAVGVMLIGYGVLYGPAFLLVGGLIFLVGLVTWLVDDARAMMAAGRSDGEHGAHG